MRSFIFILAPFCSTDQRYQIWAFRYLRPAQIARKIGKHRSVIAREIAHSGSSLTDYNPQQAHKRARQRKAVNTTKATAAIHEAIASGLTISRVALTNRASPC